MPSDGCGIPIWKLEGALKCRSCRKGRYARHVHMIKLTETRETTPRVPGASGREEFEFDSQPP